MGNALMLDLHGGGGGANLKFITATASDILLDKIGADQKGKKVVGTMPNNGAVTPEALVAGESYKIPAGYHDGNGQVAAKDLASQTEGNAAAEQIVSGYIAWVNGTQVTGSMVDNGAVSNALNCGGSYTIPAGYHNGSGKVTANSLASQTSGTAAAGDILTGKTAWVGGSKITGSMATMAGKTITPSKSAQTVSCSGKKMTGNIVVNAIPSTYVQLANGTTSFDFATISKILGGVVANYVKLGRTGSTPSPATITNIPVKYVNGLPHVNGHNDSQSYGIVFKHPIYVALLSEIDIVINSRSAVLFIFGLLKSDKTWWEMANGSNGHKGDVELRFNFSEHGVSPKASDLAYLYIGLNGKSSSTKGVVQTLKSIKLTKK